MIMHSHVKSNRCIFGRAFTLIELLVVISIISLLIAQSFCLHWALPDVPPEACNAKVIYGK